MSKIKFSEIPIGAKVLIYKQQENIKLENELVFNITLGHLENVSPDTEVELITNCINCKRFNQDHFGKDYGFFYCNKIKVNYPDGVQAEFKENPETFSCSLFEMKEE